MAKVAGGRQVGEEGRTVPTEMVSARWARSERPDSLSLLLRESPEAVAAPFSRKSVTSMARSQSPSWLWLAAEAGAGAAVRSHRSGTGEPPRAAVGATLADGLRRGATPGGGDRANSLASIIMDGWVAIESIRGRLEVVWWGERESGINFSLLLLRKKDGGGAGRVREAGAWSWRE